MFQQDTPAENARNLQPLPAAEAKKNLVLPRQLWYNTFAPTCAMTAKLHRFPRRMCGFY